MARRKKKTSVTYVEEAPRKPMSAAQIKRLNIRDRCIEEAKGRCQRCGCPKGTRLLSLVLCFQVVCAKCLGAHAAACKAAKAEAKKLQTNLFEVSR